MKKKFMSFSAILIFTLVANASVQFQEIRTASNNVIVVYFKSINTLDCNEVDTTKSKYKINGEEPLSIGKYATYADLFDHFIYLETSTLEIGKEYKIQTPHGDTTFTFNDHTTFCEAIKTNQAAYSSLSKSNRALFAIWLGSKGSRPITGNLPEFQVLEENGGKVVTEGTLRKIGSDVSSGDTVYQIDLADVPEGGPYKIVVKGYGCSYPFGVGGDFSKRLAYIIFRGQYYQRCGCPIIEPYGLQVRVASCHTTVYDTDGPIGEANIVVTGTEPTMKCIGGYHDAGDADRRAYHMSNPIINLMIYETFPDLFTDGQYNIPDKFDTAFNIIGKGNGIPDIIDEAEWGTLVWEYLQNEDGSIHWGTETKGYPDPFNKPLDKDTKKYGTVIIDDRAAAVGAGLFLHLARIMKPFNAERAQQLVGRSQKSFNYIKEKMADPEKLYYYIQKYLYDGDTAAHAQVKVLKATVDSYKKNVITTEAGYSLNDTKCDNPAYFFSYIIEKDRETDPSVVEYFKNALKDGADSNVVELKKYAYPIGNKSNSTAWGHNVRQPGFACAPLLYWRLTREQSYMDAACDLMNYILGVNPLGISYVTGLGFNQVHNPHDRESAYTKGKGWGSKPGITVFGSGPGLNRYTHVATEDPNLNVFPKFSTLPMERQYTDNRDIISNNEFTIFQTMTHYALYTVLSQGGTWDSSKDPFGTTDVKYKPYNGIAFNGIGKLSFDGRTVSANIVLKSTTQLTGGIFSLDGRCVERLKSMKLGAGEHKVLLPVSRQTQSLIKNGIFICRLTYQGKTISGNISKMK